jgi:L-2-hydroxyglutarate oxidase LhgO
MDTTTDMDTDAIVLGAGVVGLAVARALALRSPGKSVWVLEAADAIGTGSSSRNSEVLHAGIYYPAGSMKAQLCVKGHALLTAYLQERGLPFWLCGKLIVASTAEQLPALKTLQTKALANGVELTWLDAGQALAMEPALSCVAALYSPRTGLVDSHALMLSLQADVENAGGMVVLHTRVQSARPTSHGWEVRTEDGTCLQTSVLVNSAGLHAPLLAQRFEGLASQHIPKAFYAKGNYFSLAGKSPFSHLIYPLPSEAGLGVHLTLDMGKQAKFGPDVEWVDAPDDYTVHPERVATFADEIRRYWPGLPDNALQPAYSGIRPKIVGPDSPAADFMVQGPSVHGLPGLVNLFGIESPGLTSCLALGEEVARALS